MRIRGKTEEMIEAMLELAARLKVRVQIGEDDEAECLYDGTNDRCWWTSFGGVMGQRELAKELNRCLGGLEIKVKLARPVTRLME